MPIETIVERTLAQEYSVEDPSGKKVCLECDFQAYCQNEGIIEIK